MKHLGDICKLNGAEIPVVDVITGGSPCQDLSVAGKREGLAGERSGLYMEQIRIVKEMRENDRTTGRTDEHIRPRYMVWENVPGALSSNDGEDFRIVLEEAAKVCDKDAVIPRPNCKWSNAGVIVGAGWSIAWKIHDAQFIGVPQRRRRLCMLCDFNGFTAAEILFDPQLRRETKRTSADKTVGHLGREAGREVHSVGESLSRDSEPSESEREGSSEGTEGCPGSTSYTLKIRGGREIDSFGKRAGKGALVQTEKAGTVAAAQDQTLIQACDVYNQTINGETAPTITSAVGGGQHKRMQDS